MSVVIFDTETTGFAGRTATVKGRRFRCSGEVIQLSAIVCDNKLNIEDFISFYCMPDNPISDEARDVHGITNDAISKLSGGLPIEHFICDKYKNIFYSKGTVFVGHNVSFDIRSVNRDLEGYGNKPIDFGNRIVDLSNISTNKNYHMDTMQVTKDKFKYYKKPKLREAVGLCNLDNSLGSLYKDVLRKFNKNSSVNYHNSDYDTFCTWAVLATVLGN